ncbi:helix-turn-helix transcriptional regulator [Desulfovibrio sulfodismutans]|uniref:Helix-turn-helix transcriptional regulator n=1 Tax=Desulfolutivibrio sulfodismutans TaxID=63561 RepID=A0A7K3NMW0_9BACT|nr:helix-turn-helix transcriptional regulator [Desulfolutivibrio sulfodismutans]NDY57530.1 helix-turn-helix transcriptional regulator [Desulfolutivibrio sulfodismutans]QLA14340.1 helix-turn-helix domain-containing protein [Desulfolutivibrio sulfodismutans DSM 3696]
MLELTKKPRTDGMVEICAVIPESKADAVSRAIERAVTHVVPLKEIFPDSTPGSRLRSAREIHGLTQVQLAEKVGVDAPNISAVERGKRPIGKALAKKFEDVLGFPYQVFL